MEEQLAVQGTQWARSSLQVPLSASLPVLLFFFLLRLFILQLHFTCNIIMVSGVQQREDHLYNVLNPHSDAAGSPDIRHSYCSVVDSVPCAAFYGPVTILWL